MDTVISQVGKLSVDELATYNLEILMTALVNIQREVSRRLPKKNTQMLKEWCDGVRGREISYFTAPMTARAELKFPYVPSELASTKFEDVRGVMKCTSYLAYNVIVKRSDFPGDDGKPDAELCREALSSRLIDLIGRDAFFAELQERSVRKRSKNAAELLKEGNAQ